MERYSYDEMVRAYLEWASTPYQPAASEADAQESNKKRLEAWDRYCDLRDQLEPGTSFRNRTGAMVMH